MERDLPRVSSRVVYVCYLSCDQSGAGKRCPELLEPSIRIQKNMFPRWRGIGSSGFHIVVPDFIVQRGIHNIKSSTLHR
uniref:Uncharacterized protein n=1 Tax=Picea sitchensis TaxID=3332 RepID=A0A6B9XXY5_PICSI|nr:hypothetical protein Q903MT_gene5491 [Picea sitchensis]